MVTLLLDADIIAYQFASAAQKNYAWEGSDGPVSIDIVHTDREILEGTDTYIYKLGLKFNADRVIVCLSDPEVNFRKSILPTYKGNRTGPKPVKLMWLKNQFSNSYETYQRPTLEADDVMGILSTHSRLIPGKKIIVSEDKDMQTIPGWLYNPNKDTAARLISKEAADYYHMFQTLTGDTCDHYSGCPGIGKVKAEKLLHSPSGKQLGLADMWQAVICAYLAKGLTVDDALVQARVSRILRSNDYNFNRKEPRLWQPPQD